MCALFCGLAHSGVLYVFLVDAVCGRGAHWVAGINIFWYFPPYNKKKTHENMRALLLPFFILLSACCSAQSLKTEINSIYDFSPSKLSKHEQELKVPQLDKFWDKIKADTGLNLPKLRTELKASDHVPYFYFDGAELLLSLSSSNMSDKQLAAISIAKCDLADIDHGEYVRRLNQLANDGVNVTEAAVKILADPKFSFFIPQHVLTFDQGNCLAYMLVPQDPALYIDTLISIFKKVDLVAQRSIITTLWFAYTCKGDAMINVAITDAALKNEVRSFAKQALRPPKLSKDEQAYVKALTKKELEKTREEALKRFSDEALDELIISTKAMRSNSPCR